jgi:hypothetical protein
MITDSKERALYWLSLRARFAEPDTTPVIMAGHEFTRTWGKRCPWCGNVFFTYQETGREHEPYKVDPDPVVGRSAIATRETCGYPGCWDQEDRHQFQRRRLFAQAAKPEGAAS